MLAVETERPWYSDTQMPALLRRARATYGKGIRTALEAAGFDDVPVNGLYVLGVAGIDGEGVPLAQLIAELGVSKQAAGQLIDALEVRGYLRRFPDARDRRKIIVALNARGIAAATVQAQACAALDRTLAARIGADALAEHRRALAAAIELGEERRLAGSSLVRDGIVDRRQAAVSLED